MDDHQSMESESLTLPLVPQQIISTQNNAPIDKHSSSVDNSLASIDMTISTAIAEKAVATSRASTPLYGNLDRIKKADYSPVTEFDLPNIKKIDDDTSAINVPDEKEPSIHSSSSTSYEERNKKKLTENIDVTKIQQLKIKIDAHDKGSPLAVKQSVIQTEEQILDATVIEPIDSLMQSNLDRTSSCVAGKFICMLIMVLLLGLGCMSFGIYQLSLDPSSIPGWLMVSIPIFIFICGLTIRHCCLKREERVGPTNHDKEQVFDQTPGSMHPTAASQETNITSQNVLQ